MFRASFFCLLTIYFCNNLGAQQCPFAGVYGSSVPDFGTVVVPTLEKDGFYIGGSTFDSLLILKVNLNGQVIWRRAVLHSTQQYNGLGSMILDAEGNLTLITGTPQTDDPIFMTRYDPLNNSVLWTKEINRQGQILLATISESVQEQEYIVGLNVADDTSDNRFILFKVDKLTGTITELVQWSNFSHTDYIQTIHYHNNFIYTVGTFSDNEIYTRRRHGIAKIDYQTGEIVWFKLGHLAGNLNQTANFLGDDLLIFNNSIYSLYDGNVIGEQRKIYIQKTNLNGGVTWVREYELPGRSTIAHSLIVSDNGLVIFGRNSEEESDFMLFKTDFNGELLWGTSIETPLKVNSTFDMFNVFDHLSSSLIELNNSLIFTKWGRLNIIDDDLVFGSTDLHGQVNTSCMKSQPIIMTVKEVLNSVFYNVDPDSTEIQWDFNNAETFVYNAYISARLECTFEKIENVNTSICEGEDFEGYTQSGIYSDTFDLSTGCDSIRILHLTVLDPLTDTISKNICHNETFEGYTISGTYIDTFTLTNGCDSIRVLHLSVFACAPVIYYDLNACRAYMEDASHMDYSEFTPAYPEFTCAQISAEHLTRITPQENKHSCTPGVNNTIAMCINTFPSCTFESENGSAIIIDFTVTSLEDSLFRLSEINFYEKAPVNYIWIDGPTGPNNYPTLYGIRVLKDNVEIFRKENVPTTANWTLQSFRFIDDPLFAVDGNANFRIELLPYCPVGNGATVSAWDIDEISIVSACAPISISSSVSGKVLTMSGAPVPAATVSLADNDLFEEGLTTITSFSGNFLFDTVMHGTVFLKAHKNDDVMNGVNVLDLILIQKHLLGINTFTSLHEYIAADVNHDNIVSATDLVELQKLLLGIYTVFPNNTSWRLGPQQDMTGIDISLFREFHTIKSLIQPAMVDFIGIKIGDVDNSRK